MKGTIVRIVSFTPSDKKHVTIEILGEENYIGNHFFNGMEVEVNELNKSDVSGRVCDNCGSEMRITEEWYCDKCGD